jgi:hypothetical protein
MKLETVIPLGSCGPIGDIVDVMELGRHHCPRIYRDAKIIVF